MNRTVVTSVFFGASFAGVLALAACGTEHTSVPVETDGEVLPIAARWQGVVEQDGVRAIVRWSFGDGAFEESVERDGTIIPLGSSAYRIEGNAVVFGAAAGGESRMTEEAGVLMIDGRPLPFVAADAASLDELYTEGDAFGRSTGGLTTGIERLLCCEACFATHAALGLERLNGICCFFMGGC